MKGVIDWTKTRKKAQEMLERVGLEHEDINAPVSSLGVGKQQLIEIAKAMAKKVELLILDEPTAALNDEESQKLLSIMLELKNRESPASLFRTSSMRLNMYRMPSRSSGMARRLKH